MDLITVVVLLLTVIVAVVLVFFERNSRWNDAKLKAEAAGKSSPALQPRLVPNVKDRRKAAKKVL